MSTVGNYVEDASSNGVMSQMGISVLDGGTGTKKAGVISTSNSPITYTSERFAVGSDKLGDIITLISSQTINVYDSSNNITATKSFSSNNTIDEVLSFLNSSNLTASINNGVISITSADGHYVKDSSADGILSKLGIGSNTTGSGSVGNTVQSSSAIIRREKVYATLDTKLDDLGISTWDLEIKNSSGTVIAKPSYGSLETLGDLVDFFNANGITTTFDRYHSTLSISSDSGNYVDAGPSSYVTDSILKKLNIFCNNVFLGDAIGGMKNSGGVYYLSSAEDIYALGQIDKYGTNITLILLNDIDMADSSGYSSGTYTNGIVTLYGNGHVIKNLEKSLIWSVGEAHIYDLGLENTKAPLIDECNGGEVVNCYTTGSINSTNEKVGGFVNTADKTSFTNCYSTCTIYSDSDRTTSIGGFVGGMGIFHNNTYTNCYATGNVVSTSDKCTMAGGFVGDASGNDKYINCFATGNVDSCAIYAGGFAGRAHSNTLFDSCYATGNATRIYGSSGAGFVCGISDNTDEGINNCYSSGSSTSGNVLDFTSFATTKGKALSSGEAAPFTYSTYTGFMMGVTHAKAKTETPSVSSSNDPISYTGSLPITRFSTIDYSGTISVVNNGVENTISISSSDTFDSLITQLANQGITASLTNGKFKINGGSSTCYVKSIDSSLESALRLSGPYYSTSGSTTNTPSNVQKVSTASNVTELTKLSDLGISSNMTINTVSNGVANTISVVPATTMSELLQMLRNIGFTASLSSGKLTIKGSETSYIESMDSALENVLKISGPYYTTSTIMTKTNSNSNKLTYTDTIAMNDNTTLAELGITSNQTVIINQNKTDKTISLSKTDSLATMLSKFSSAGISGYISDGKLNIDASDSAYIKTMPSVLKTALKLSGAFSQEKEVTITPGFGIITGGHVINLQVGVDASPESVISFDTSFSLVNLATILANGLTADDLLDKIDATIATVTAKQTMLGAIANRLDSVLESLNINYMNQSSALSTIRDVDIAQVSSKYIRSMILSQASASLLTTANQSPNIALTLIRGFGR